MRNVSFDVALLDEDGRPALHLVPADVGHPKDGETGGKGVEGEAGVDGAREVGGDNVDAAEEIAEDQIFHLKLD